MRSFAILGVVALLLASCSQRSYLPARSKLVKEAASSGVHLASPDEERARFYALERAQEERILTLIRGRSSAEFDDRSYKIGPGDEVELAVFDVPELNITAKVGQSGFLALPLVGAVQASGRTESELQAALRDRLAVYVRNPQASVAVSKFASQKVAVMGAVKKPGSYALKRGGHSLLELLSQAGGVTEKAGNFVNLIPAEHSGISSGIDSEARARLALASSRESVSSNGIEVYLDQVMGTRGGVPLEIPVLGGDMILVPEAGKVMVEGEVGKGGSIDLGQQMTLLGALAAAGGITYAASIDEVELVRDVGINNKIHLVLDLRKIAQGEERDPRLRNGDIVRVPSHSGRRFTQDTFDAISRVINFGVGSTYNIQ